MMDECFCRYQTLMLQVPSRKLLVRISIYADIIVFFASHNNKKCISPRELIYLASN